MPALLLIVVLVALGIWLHRLGIRNRRKMLARRLSVCLNGSEFTPAVQEEVNAIQGLVGIDVDRRRVAIVDLGQASIFDFHEILSVEPLFDGSPAFPSQSGAATGAVVGLALAGGIGAVIGALAGSGRKVRRLSLRIDTSRILEPTSEIVFYHGQAKRVDDRILSAALKDLQDWAGRFNAIISQGHATPDLVVNRPNHDMHATDRQLR